jgi:hypothetical protein
VDLTAAAAFTAAALSFVSVVVSVVLTYRLTSRGHREQWLREQERPIVARILTLSAEARDEWWDISVARQRMDTTPWVGSETQQKMTKDLQLLHDLRYEVAQLDLLASRPVREAARELVMAHDKEALRLVLTTLGEDDSEDRRDSQVKIKALEEGLVERTRADLGLGPGLQVPPNSLRAKFLGRSQQ